MPRKRILITLLLSLLTVLFACKKEPEPEFRLLRLIDSLRMENVVLSPLANLSEEEQDGGAIFPEKSNPIQDLASGENPYRIKRKIKLGGAEVNALFAPTESRFLYNLRVPDGCYLEFGIGIVRDKNSERLRQSSGKMAKGVLFLVSLELKGKRKIIFQKHCSLPEKGDPQTYSLHRVDLPSVHEGVSLTLETRGEGGSFAYWFNPVIHNKDQEPRRVILISVDTLRADHLGCYGYERNTSPHIDALASDGVLFLNTYASSPWTLPSHVSLLTSLHGIHHQVYQDDERMDPSLLTLADLLRKEQINCSALTGGGFVSAVFGFSKGFDFYRDGVGGIFRQESAELLSRVVSEWLDQNEEKSFFLFLHTYQPHSPYACPFPYKTMFLEEGAKWRHIDLLGYLGGRPGIFKGLPEEERQNAIGLYDGEIRYTDEKFIGILLSRLKEKGLYDQTMIVFTSDHGEEFHEHGGWGHGHSLYDESLKVPLVIKFPGSKFKGMKIENIVSLVDIMPTILEELEIDFSGVPLDGKSLFPVIEGEEKGDREFLADVGDNILNSRIPQKTAMNRGKEKLILNKEFKEKDLDFFVSPPPPYEAVELYDLKKDSLERNNIAHGRTSLVSTMISEIQKLYSERERGERSRPQVDERLKEQLRALGYIK